MSKFSGYGFCPDCGTWLIDVEVIMEICLACDYLRQEDFERELNG